MTPTPTRPTRLHPYVRHARFSEVIPVASRTTRRHPRDDHREDVGVDVGVGVGAYSLLCRSVPEAATVVLATSR